MSDQFDDDYNAMNHGHRCVERLREQAAEIAALRTEIKRLTAECMKPVPSSTLEVATLQKEIAALRTEIERLKTANEHWHTRVNLTIATEDQLAQAQAEVERLDQEHAAVCGKYVGVRDEIAALRTKLEDCYEMLERHHRHNPICPVCDWLAANREKP